MTTTPVWVPLVVAGLGVLGTIVGTIAGVLITQRRSDQREAQVWNRERERERERWAREDALRTFEERRKRYESFYDAVQERARSAFEHGRPMPGLAPDGSVPLEWHPMAHVKLEQLQLYGSAEVAAAAKAAYDVCENWWVYTVMSEGEDPMVEEFADRYEEAVHTLQEAIRRDLAIPPVSEVRDA